MRRIFTILSILAVSIILNSVQYVSAESPDVASVDKDECLLVAMNCGETADTIQQRIERLDREIAKGADVYTKDELRSLGLERDEAVKTLESFINGN